jgi:Mg-chelatase subunit ChlD
MRMKTIIPAFAFVLAVPVALPAASEDAKKVGDLVKKIERLVKGEKEEEALKLVRELGAIQGPEALKGLFGLGVAIGIPDIYNEVTRLLAERKDDDSFKFYETQAKEASEEGKIYLADLMAEVKGEKAAGVLGILAEEKKETILRSAVASLGRLRIRGSVEPLLKVLEKCGKDRGQLYQETRDALFYVTNQDFDNTEDWRKWWDTRKAIFDPTKESKGATKVRTIKDRAPEFAGKKIFGRNVIFVIDVSGTMRYVMKDDIPGLGSGDGTDSGGTKPPTEQITPENDRLAKFWTRIEMAKRALTKALSAFDQKVQFNIIKFHTKVLPMEKGLILAGAGRKKAIDWVKNNVRFEPGGATNIAEALEKAFKVDRRVTEIYFLSDGLPSADGKKNDPPDPILEKVDAMNRFRKIKIHTFGYDPLILRSGDENPELIKANEFLKKLAKKTGGSFTLLKVTEEKPPEDFR